MSDDRGHDPLSDVINLFAAPIAGGLRTVEQMRRGVEEMLRAMENLNRTMENLNEVATRINSLMAEVEGPVRAMMPQLTRTIQAADAITQGLEGPVRKAAPNFERIIDTLASPGFATLPNQLGDVLQSIGDVSRRLVPLTQLAENAGGLFGGLRIPGLGGRPTTPAPAPEPEPAPAKPAPAKPAAKKPAAKKPAAKKAPAATPGRR